MWGQSDRSILEIVVPLYTDQDLLTLARQLRKKLPTIPIFIKTSRYSLFSRLLQSHVANNEQISILKDKTPLVLIEEYPRDSPAIILWLGRRDEILPLVLLPGDRQGERHRIYLPWIQPQKNSLLAKEFAFNLFELAVRINSQYFSTLMFKESGISEEYTQLLADNFPGTDLGMCAVFYQITHLIQHAQLINLSKGVNQNQASQCSSFAQIDALLATEPKRRYKVFGRFNKYLPLQQEINDEVERIKVNLLSVIGYGSANPSLFEQAIYETIDYAEKIKLLATHIFQLPDGSKIPIFLEHFELYYQPFNFQLKKKENKLLSPEIEYLRGLCRDLMFINDGAQIIIKQFPYELAKHAQTALAFARVLTDGRKSLLPLLGGLFYLLSSPLGLPILYHLCELKSGERLWPENVNFPESTVINAQPDFVQFIFRVLKAILFEKVPCPNKPFWDALLRGNEKDIQFMSDWLDKRNDPKCKPIADALTELKALLPGFSTTVTAPVMESSSASSASTSTSSQQTSLDAPFVLFVPQNLRAFCKQVKACHAYLNLLEEKQENEQKVFMAVCDPINVQHNEPEFVKACDTLYKALQHHKINKYMLNLIKNYAGMSELPDLKTN